MEVTGAQLRLSPGLYYFPLSIASVSMCASTHIQTNCYLVCITVIWGRFISQLCFSLKYKCEISSVFNIESSDISLSWL